MPKGVVDIFLVYQFLKRLVTPFEEMDAYKLGLIDEKGKRIKKASSPAEKAAVGYFDRLVINLKRLLAKVPGGNTKLATYSAALLLLREEDERLLNLNYLEEEFNKSLDSIDLEVYNEFEKLLEDAPAMSTGAAVAGTGDDPIHWSYRQPKIGPKGKLKKYGQPLDANAFLRRKNLEFYKKTFPNSKIRIGK